MNIRNFKSSITQIPTYLDGYFDLYAIVDDDGVFPIDKAKLVVEMVPFEMISISDRLRFEADQRQIEVTYKLRIQQDKSLNSMHLLKINGQWHRVYNVYHFMNKDGYPQSDVTLIYYDREVEIIDH